uniref:Myosin motor domain-containing protein n=1 Tax=Globisporangium ultimum (strain ATCC 200006 / CBS 805.95 / DAOM BR144) TaxID=431595 RepID=K3XAY3_GLOUD
MPAVVVRSGYMLDDVTEREEFVTVVHTEDGEEREIRGQPLVKLPSVHHPKQLPPLNIHDLSSLPLMATNGDVGRNEYFSKEQLENTVLYTLRARYRMEQIYTWVDRVLVSVNPVVALPIYTPDHMQEYNKSREQTPLFENGVITEAPPHIFAIAQNAIRCMQDAAEDQAVILLGGMGSGKSEAAKLIVQYLCEIGENTVRPETQTDTGVLHPIGQQILHALYILEAFGNASTLQNRNSSRFAKMISVEFDKHGHVIGGGFTTHYFEKSRVIGCRPHERNFHVFYQILAGLQQDTALRDAVDLNRTVADFELLKTADPEMTDPALDARDYRDLMASFSALRIRKSQRVEIIRILAALLHLGNVDFVQENDGKPVNSNEPASCALKDPSQIVLAAKLLEVEPVVLDNYFRTRQFFSKDGNKTVSSLKVVTVSQARRARDTFIRSLYEALFNFLVETLNGILGGIFDRYEKSNIVINSQGVHVLDIVGFENLESSQNGFDQLCFNYWSEKVQSFYVHNTLAVNFSDLDDEPQHVENRLTAYSNMDIATDQEECLSLFERDPFGIFSLLNDHSKMRSPNDEDLVTKILAANDSARTLSRPNMGGGIANEYLAPSKDWRLLFVVHHYAGKVTYSGKGLAAKNTLSISATCAAIMHSSSNAVLHAVGAAQMAAASNEKASRGAGAASSKFRQSISSAKEAKQASPNDTASSDVLKQADDLLHALNHTGKNFLVCVKPNEELEEGLFDSDYVLKQIRQSHLVDLITASRSIYTVHLTYNHFFRQYKNICGHRGTLESLLRSLSAIGVLEEDKYVVGKLKVYLTSHQSKKLEKARFLYLNACATMIQRNMLRGVFRKKSSRLLYVMRGLQQAMKQRDTDDIIQHLANCTSILGKANASDIRVLNEGKRMISSLDEEDYVKSVIADATKIGHPSLIDYAIRITEKYCPSVKIDHLKKQRKTVLPTAAQRQRDENLEVIHKRLRESIIKNDPEALMAALATLEEPSAESLERQLATMMIIRALEEKSVIDQLTHATESIDQDDDADKIYEVLHAQMIKAIELGLEAKFPHLAITFGGERLKSSQIPEVVVQPESKPTPPPFQPENSVASFDPSALLAALEKALDEENFIAAEKVLSRLKALGVPSNDMIKSAEQKIRDQLSSISSHSERKQTIKFLGIAKLSQDLELLNEAIEAAVNNGVAKWDFNLKNAEREREKLLTANGDAPAVPPTPAATTPKSISTPAPVTPPKPVTTKAEYLFQVWSATDAKILRAVKLVVPAELKEAVDSKVARIEKVLQAEKNIQLALASKDTKMVEEAFKQSISMGFCSIHFGSLFEHYTAISKSDSVSTETDELRATIKFLKNRMDAKAEIREDALGLLSSVIDEFSRTKDMHEDDNEDVLVTAGKLRRQLEACVAAAVRLESVLVMPPESISVNALELNIQAARNAGVNERLLVKAEEKIVVVKKAAMNNRTKTRSIQSAPVMGLDDEFDAQLLEIQRNRSDTTGWPGVPDDDGNDLTEQNQRQAQEKDAVAFNQFENLRGFNAQSEKALAKKLCWDGRALSQSLSVLDDVSANQLALSINRCILGYMRDRIVFYREMLAQFVLQSGLAKPAVVDEIYLQLMKQLTRNPKRDSSTRGWSLFSMCATSFPPSEALQPYVLMFLKAQHTESNSFWRLVRNFASYSLMKLENLLANGATGFIPSIEEIRGFEARPPFLAKIELLDGTVLNDAFPVTPELTVEHLIEICSHFLGLEDHVANFLGLSTISEKFTGSISRRGSAVAMLLNANTHNEGTNGDDFSADTEKNNETSGKDATANTSSLSYFHKLLAAPAFLNTKAFLGDIFEKELIRGREVRFVLKIRLSPAYMLQYSDEMYDRLTYIQVLDEIVKGNLPLLEEDSVLRLASLSIAVDCGEDPPESVGELFDMNIFDYIPSDWHSVHSEEEWADLVLQFISENLVEEGLIFPASELQRAYVEEVTRHRLYGAAFFPCKLLNRGGSSSRSGSKRDAGGGVGACLGIELPSYFVLAVNSYGVHFLGRDGAILAFCEYMDVVYCGGSYHQYKINLKKASDPSASAEEVLLTTKYSDELSALIADYKEITALINES